MMDAFNFFELEVMQAGGVIVFCPVCTWRNILKRKKRFYSDNSVTDLLLELQNKNAKAKKIWSSLKRIKK
jgi:hypothetical protein